MPTSTSSSRKKFHKGYEIIFRTNTQPSEVIGADMSADKRLMLHVKWIDGTDSLVYATEANKRLPQLVIAFYEKNLYYIKQYKK